jgi:transposase
VARQVALLMRHYQYLKNLIEEFNEEIKVISERPKYRAKVEALNTFRGLSTLSSLTITVELGDIKRFKHPAHLVGYIGLNVIEYSSGGRERKFGVSCMGNRHVRTTLVEAAQLAMRTPKVNRSLRSRREGVENEITMIADRCMARLYAKGTRLLLRDKNRNKVKVACAREMIGFIWEALNKVS